MNVEAAVVMTKIFFADICIQLKTIKYQNNKEYLISTDIVKLFSSDELEYFAKSFNQLISLILYIFILNYVRLSASILMVQNKRK